MRTKKTSKAKKKTDDAEKELPRPMRFEVITGIHYEKNDKGVRVRYCTGDIIESFRPLDEKFKNKFKRIDHDGGPLPEKQQTGFRTINKAGGRFDVINEETGVVINENFLTLEEAKELERAAGVPFSELEPRLQNMLSKEEKAKLNPEEE